MLNGSDFKRHSKMDQPGHSKSDRIAAILDSHALVPFLVVRTIAVAMVLIMLLRNHPKSEHKIV